MVILDSTGAVIESPDLEAGYLVNESMSVTHAWVVDVPEEGHWETIAEYQNGGKDIEWRIDTPEDGHWETRDGDGNIVEHFDGFIPDDLPHEEEHPDVWEFQRYVTYTDEELADIRAQNEAAEVAAKTSAQTMAAVRMMVQPMAASLTDAQILTIPLLFDEWAAGMDYKADEVLRHDGELYRVAQGHTSQPQWEPGATGTESLYTHITVDPETGYDVWQQPTGSHDAYNRGDRVLYPDESGKVYESTIDGNTWSPDVYPAGWEEVSE